MKRLPWGGGSIAPRRGGLASQSSPGSGGGGVGDDAAGYAFGIGGVCGACYAAASTAFYAGDAVVGAVFPNAPGASSPFKFWLSTGLLYYLFFFFLFCLCIYGLAKLIASLPLKPDWEAHARFNSKMKFCPFFVLGVLYLTNLDVLSTRLINHLYTPRMFASYLAALLGTTYIILYGLTVPDNFRKAYRRLGLDGVPEKGWGQMVVSRPAARYILSLIGFTSVAISTWLTLLLLPNSFSKAPRDWWEIFIPKF